MNSPAIGIGLYFWLRFRWVAGAMLAYLLALAAAARLPALHRSPDQAVAVIGLAAMALLVPFLYLVNGFTYGPTDLAARASGFPRHMLSFPASTRALVGWPMLYGGTTVAGFWMVVCLVLSACGPSVPLLWPALECWAVLAWIQAIAWVPFPVPIARAIVLIPILLALVGGGIFCAMMDIPPGAIAAGCSAMILLAYAVAVRGAARFRRGDGDGSGLAALFGRSEDSPSQSPAEAGRRTRPPFRSPAGAQLWYECRRNIAFLPAMTAVTCVAMFFPLVRAAREYPIPRIPLGPFDVAVPVFGLWACLVSLYAISGMAGAGLGKADYWGKLSQWPAFLTTRPFSSGDFVLAKLKAAAIGSALSCAILLLFALLGSILVPSPFDRGQSLATWAVHHASLKSVMYGMLAIGLLLFCVWRNQVGGLFLPLGGRGWFMTAFGVVPSILFLFTIAGVGIAASRHAEVLQAARRGLPWLLFVFAGVNLSVGIALSALLRRLRMMQPRTMAILAVVWLAIVAALLAMVHGYLRAYPVLIAAALLSLPATRLLAAPLTLRWNRHR